MSAIAAEAVSMKLGGRQVLDAIDLTVGAGEFLALVGPNGAGKTSLLRCFAGLLRPTAGRIRLVDRDLQMISPSERAKRIAYLPQDSAIHWPIAVTDLVMLGRLPHRARGFARANVDDHAAVARVVAQYGLDHLANRPVTALSGGELRRVLLARAMATSPEVLLADEPTSALDPGHQLDVMAALRLAAAEGVTVVAATHDLALAARFASQVALIFKGGLVRVGPPGDVLTPANLEDCFGVRPAAGGDGISFSHLERAGDAAGR